MGGNQVIGLNNSSTARGAGSDDGNGRAVEWVMTISVIMPIITVNIFGQCLASITV
jgi:hypothetical protein